MPHRRPTRPARTKHDPTRPAGAQKQVCRRWSLEERSLPENRKTPPGTERDKDSDQEPPVLRPFWRDPDRLDLHPIPDEAWDVFELDQAGEPEPETGDFWMEPCDDEPCE